MKIFCLSLTITTNGTTHPVSKLEQSGALVPLKFYWFYIFDFRLTGELLVIGESTIDLSGVPLQGNGKFAKGAYYVVGRLLRLIVLLPIVNKYIVKCLSEFWANEAISQFSD